MLRRALATAAAALCLAPASVAAAAPARAVLEDCERGVEAPDRAGVFEGQMRTVPGAARMQMRFTLQASTPDRERWTSVAARGFGEWVTADPGTARYVYTKRVENLLAPASYRAVVRFRWLDAAGETVERARAVTRACRQPDPRPDLAVRAITELTAGRYALLIRNDGRTASPETAVTLSVDGAVLPATAVPALEAREEALVGVEGPPCPPGGEVEAEVDPAGAVEERAEGDNRLSRFC
jgi:hypothetical protein